MGSNHLFLVGNPMNTPLRVQVLKAFSRKSSSISKERERVIASTLPSIPIGSVSRSRFELLGRRLRVYKTSAISFFIFTMWIWFGNIWIWGVVFVRIPLKFKNVIFSMCIGFRKKPWIVMHVPNLIQAWKTERSKFFLSKSS